MAGSPDKKKLHLVSETADLSGKLEDFPYFLRAFLGYHPLQSILHYYADLSTFLIPPSIPGGWRVLNRRKRVMTLYELEVKYGKLDKREKFADRCFEQAREALQTVCGTHLGFKDLFVPIAERERFIGFLQCGAFSTEEMSAEKVAECWRQLTGRKIFSPLNEFQEFTRVLLAVPVLDERTYRALQESLELFAGLLVGGVNPETAGTRLWKLLIDVFAKTMPHSYWMNWAIGLPTYEPVPAWGRHIENWDWVQNEIGITRIPTTVIAAIPKQTELKPASWLKESIKVHQLQRNGFRFAQTLPETVGGKLEDYGLVFVTSAPREYTKPQRLRWILQLAEKIKDFTCGQFNGPVRVGVGQMMNPGQALYESYRQALLAIHLSRQPDGKILLYDPVSSPPSTESTSNEVGDKLRDLATAFETGAFAQLEASRNRYIEAVLRQRNQDPDFIRVHFHYAFIHLVELSLRGTGRAREEAGTLRAEGERDLVNVATPQDAILAFNLHLERLEHFLTKPRSFESAVGMEKARQYIDEHFRESLRVGFLARIAGVSAVVFGKKFHQLTGDPFGQYVRELRIKHAQRLLSSGSMPVSKVAAECGFKSVPTFIQTFRRVTGLTPNRYREDQR